MSDIHQILAAMTESQLQALREGRARDCYVNHPNGTRCPNCANWPYKKGGAADFVAAAQLIIGATQ